MSATRRPPYSRDLGPGTIWIAVGRDAWTFKAADMRRNLLVLPDEDDPDAYSWPVKGREVIAMDKGASLQQMSRLGRLLVESGAASAILLSDMALGGMAIMRPKAVDHVA